MNHSDLWYWILTQCCNYWHHQSYQPEYLHLANDDKLKCSVSEILTSLTHTAQASAEIKSNSYQLQRSSQERMCRCLQNISLFIGYEYRYIKYGWWCDVHCSVYYLGRLLPALLICCHPHSLLWTLSTELLSSREYISHCHNHVLPTLTATISNN